MEALVSSASAPERESSAIAEVTGSGEVEFTETSANAVEVICDEGMSPERRGLVLSVFGEMGSRLGLSGDLSARLTGNRIELVQSNENNKDLLAEYVVSGEGRSIRIYDGALLDKDGNEISSDRARRRLEYLIEHELSHAVIETGAVLDTRRLHEAISRGASSEISDHILQYSAMAGARHLERHFTRDQIDRFQGSEKGASDKWHIANEVVAERFREYLLSGGVKDDFIMRRLTGLRLDKYIVESFPDKNIQPIQGEEDASRFWQDVAQSFGISIIENYDPRAIYEALSLEGGPLEALRGDIDFWHKSFSESFEGVGVSSKTDRYLRAQDEMSIDREHIWSDTMGDEYGEYNGFDDMNFTPGQMPEHATVAGGGGKGKTVPDSLFEIAMMMAGRK